MTNFSKDDAVALSLGLRKVTLEDIKKEYKLPDDAKFCGYLVHIEEADEFLAKIEETPTVTKRAFSKSPEHALVFDEVSEAFNLARAEKNEIVAGMFDVGSQLLVFPIR
jgi:hypothetical protein